MRDLIHRVAAIRAMACTAVAAGAAALTVSPDAHAEFTGVEVRHFFVDIDGYGPARVVRLYAAFTDPGDRLIHVWGNQPHPMLIEAGGQPFFFSEGGGTSAPLQGLFPFVCNLRYDTYVDIGRVASDTGGNLLLTPGFEFDASALQGNNDSWGRIPVDPLGLAGADGMVFFGQFTVPENAPPLTGTVNFGLWDAGATEGHAVFGFQFSDAAASVVIPQADLDGNQRIDIDDLISVIVNWGQCEPCPGECDECFCYGDVDRNGSVDPVDMICVIDEWGTM